MMQVGLVGSAHWARTVHAPGLAGSSHVQFAGVWARDFSKAAELAKAHDTQAFRDYDDLLDAVDAVSFAVPPNIQPSLAQRAIRQGKHVLLEKPIADSLASGSQLVRDIEQAEIRSVVFLTRLFHPVLHAGIAEAAETGGWSSANMRIASNTMRVASPYSGSIWRKKPNAALWDLGPHMFSVLWTVMGPIIGVKARRDERGHIRVHAIHSAQRESHGELSLQARDEDIANETSFTGSNGHLSLPTVDFAHGGAASAYEAALAQLSHQERGPNFCDAHFGLELLKLLQECEDQLGQAPS
ncbi:MAG: Gfo/Idh/MocA family oxidoreductase [Mesorhizobium sp.]|uniref:Gfo/Idh/MocA family protein n=2 Tax=Mesorhizobium sp. TaxID=1871066 RepID=UPI000FE6E3AE|nr:Gfo/Idh/MocA family oxidoreductase [Mesorhizobium sp.]RWB35813.1 MAG: Gfo/Idh/MocA family oxidoreductase [Mesorhizobium sp.]RWD43170.1 MAG: Gfo/Idh/MocA family oxidoreductase [Mesorhizobium sp.]RWF58932.1 MAG: Gfo/Idh/MocA family oxidoreductase [Mesorhizobium sp.]TIX72235.1 MAG: Gfo/Idh/MocA family oxidoreductase [Mesorhizobium sp.]TIY07791.1 MAG: Gfo/Idh/MocA family oxidoreductase [Mesorhizobium sp.]